MPLTDVNTYPIGKIFKKVSMAKIQFEGYCPTEQSSRDMN